MPHVLIRDLPEEVHHALLRRASRQGRSLQQYLTAVLTREATTPTLDDVLDRVTHLQDGHFTLAEAMEALHQGREEG